MDINKLEQSIMKKEETNQNGRILKQKDTKKTKKLSQKIKKNEHKVTNNPKKLKKQSLVSQNQKDIAKKSKANFERKIEVKNKPDNINRERRLQNSNSTYQKSVFINGYPVNVTNFTSNGTNLTAMAIVLAAESVGLQGRLGFAVDASSILVYQSQNVSISSSLADYSVEINTNGIDLYHTGFYSFISLEAVGDLMFGNDGSSGAANNRERKLKSPRKLKGITALSFIVAYFIGLWNLI